MDLQTIVEKKPESCLDGLVSVGNGGEGFVRDGCEKNRIK